MKPATIDLIINSKKLVLNFDITISDEALDNPSLNSPTINPNKNVTNKFIISISERRLKSTDFERNPDLNVNRLQSNLIIINNDNEIRSELTIVLGDNKYKVHPIPEIIAARTDLLIILSVLIIN
jgi:hypothetical protein